MMLEVLLVALALVTALLAQPWRMLRRTPLITPLLAILVILPWLWALPRLHAMPLQLQWSGACLAVLLLGWPLAIPALTLVALIAALLAQTPMDTMVAQLAWQGVVPATLALVLGALVRRWVGTHPFVYLLGRAFLGTAACAFAAATLSQLAGHGLQGIDPGLALVARWLMSWGDAFVTGLVAAVFVAFRPQWLATWSDGLYLRR